MNPVSYGLSWVDRVASIFALNLSRMLGNFPQAYSHVGLINCALSLSGQTGPIEERAEPDEGSIDFAADKAAAAELTRSP